MKVAAAAAAAARDCGGECEAEEAGGVAAATLSLRGGARAAIDAWRLPPAARSAGELGERHGDRVGRSRRREEAAAAGAVLLHAAPLRRRSTTRRRRAVRLAEGFSSASPQSQARMRAAADGDGGGSSACAGEDADACRGSCVRRAWSPGSSGA